MRSIVDDFCVRDMSMKHDSWLGLNPCVKTQRQDSSEADWEGVLAFLRMRETRQDIGFISLIES